MGEGFEPKAPDFKGDGVSIWKTKDKEGNTALNVKKPEWKQGIVCFKYIPKPKIKEETVGEDL